MTTNFGYSYATIIERFSEDYPRKDNVRYFRPSIFTNIPSTKVVERSYAKASKILQPLPNEYTESIDGYYSYHRLIWFLPRGFHSALRFDSEMEEDGLTFCVTADYHVTDFEQGTIWYRIYAVKSAHHNLYIKYGTIGVPIKSSSWINRTAPWNIYKEIWLTSWQLFIRSWFRTLPHYQTYPLSDFTEGHYHQPPLRLTNLQSKGDWDVIGRIPWGQSAPTINRVILYEPFNPNVEVATIYAASIPLPDDDLLDFRLIGDCGIESPEEDKDPEGDVAGIL
jgi:hypothetical protein